MSRNTWFAKISDKLYRVSLGRSQEDLKMFVKTIEILQESVPWILIDDAGEAILDVDLIPATHLLVQASESRLGIARIRGGHGKDTVKGIDVKWEVRIRWSHLEAQRGRAIETCFTGIESPTNLAELILSGVSSLCWWYRSLYDTRTVNQSRL